MPRYGDKIVCGAANALHAAAHCFLQINIWSHPVVTPMVLNTPIASGVLRLCRALVPARLRNHDQQNEQGIEDARHGEDQEDRNRGAALAVGTEHPPPPTTAATTVSMPSHRLMLNEDAEPSARPMTKK